MTVHPTERDTRPEKSALSLDHVQPPFICRISISPPGRTQLEFDRYLPIYLLAYPSAPPNETHLDDDMEEIKNLFNNNNNNNNNNVSI